MEHKAFLIVTKAVLADKRISATAKLLLAVLNDHRNKETGQCNPRRETLAAELGTGTQVVKRALGELRAAGFLTSTKGQRANTYAPCTGNPAGSKSTGRKNPAGSKSTGAPVQNRPAEVRASLLTEPDLMNQRGAADAHSDIAAASPKPPHRGGRGALFPLFWQCFVNAGVALNSSDEAAARHAFERFPVEEQERIGKWVIEQLQTVWRSAQFTPTPLNALRGRGWTRQAAPRIVPKPPTRADEWAERLLKRHPEIKRG